MGTAGQIEGGQAVYRGKLMQAMMTCFYVHKRFMPLAAQFYKLSPDSVRLHIAYHHLTSYAVLPACLSVLVSKTMPAAAAAGIVIVVVQWLSCVRLSASLWTAAHQAPVLYYLLEFAPIHAR